MLGIKTEGQKGFDRDGVHFSWSCDPLVHQAQCCISWDCHLSPRSVIWDHLTGRIKTWELLHNPLHPLPLSPSDSRWIVFVHMSDQQAIVWKKIIKQGHVLSWTVLYTVKKLSYEERYLCWLKSNLNFNLVIKRMVIVILQFDLILLLIGLESVFKRNPHPTQWSSSIWNIFSHSLGQTSIIKVSIFYGQRHRCSQYLSRPMPQSYFLPFNICIQYEIYVCFIICNEFKVSLKMHVLLNGLVGDTTKPTELQNAATQLGRGAKRGKQCQRKAAGLLLPEEQPY